MNFLKEILGEELFQQVTGNGKFVTHEILSEKKFEKIVVSSSEQAGL